MNQNRLARAPFWPRQATASFAAALARRFGLFRAEMEEPPCKLASRHQLIRRECGATGCSSVAITSSAAAHMALPPPQRAVCATFAFAFAFALALSLSLAATTSNRLQQPAAPASLKKRRRRHKLKPATTPNRLLSLLRYIKIISLIHSIAHLLASQIARQVRDHWRHPNYLAETYSSAHSAAQISAFGQLDAHTHTDTHTKERTQAHALALARSHAGEAHPIKIIPYSLSLSLSRFLSGQISPQAATAATAEAEVKCKKLLDLE